MTNVPYNISHIMHNPDCQFGIGCMLKSINDLTNNWAFLSILLTFYVIANFALIKNGNDTLKSFIATTTAMMFLCTIGYVFGLLNDIWLVSSLIILAILMFVLILINRNR